MEKTKLLSTICATVFAIIITACGNSNEPEERQTEFSNPYKDNRNSQSINSEQDSQNPIESLTEFYNEDEPDYNYEYEPIDISFDNNIAVANYESEISYAIICNDGTVKTMGSNKYGQLGCGSTDTIQGWNTISELQNVNQIVGVDIIFLALTDEGDLYYWGGLTTTPTKIETNIRIQKFKRYVNNILFAEDDNLNIYSIKIDTDGSDYRYKAPVFETTDYPRGSTPALDGYILNGHFYTKVYKDGNFEQIFSKSNNIKSNPIGHYFITDEGSLMRIRTNSDDELEEQDLGGVGIKDYRDTYVKHENGCSEYELLIDGDLQTRGNNDYGQLGDGTKYSSDSYLNVISNVSEIYVPDSSKRSTNGDIFAITNDGNVYSWGKNFTSTPTIIINNQDFYNELTY